MTPPARGAIAAVAVAGGVAIAHALPESGPTICPFALGTGTACPLCGMTRAGLWLFRGDVATSFWFHPLLIPVLAVALVAWLGPKAKWLEPSMTKAAVIAAAFVVVWVVRLLAGTLPPV